MTFNEKFRFHPIQMCGDSCLITGHSCMCHAKGDTMDVCCHQIVILDQDRISQKGICNNTNF